MTENKSPRKSDDPLPRLQIIFYGRGADAKITFKDGGEIKVNKALLAAHSSYFNEVFYGTSPQNELHVPDFDSETFKLFLDCLMGFKPYNDLDALLLFPIAHKYHTEESLNECKKVLHPKVMNETVCHTLNLALYYENQDLIDSVVKFLKNNCNITALLESDKYCSYVLEPAAITKLLEDVEIDFYLFKLICKWAENYLNKSKKSVEHNISLFLKENNILNKLMEITFESVKCNLDFFKFNREKNILTSEQMVNILEKNMAIDYPRKFPSDSMWVDVKKGEILEEVYTKSLNFTNCGSFLFIYVWRNEVVLMDSITAGEDPVLCEINFDCFTSSGVNSLNSETKSYIFSKKDHYWNINNNKKKTVYRFKLDLTTPNIFMRSFKVKYTFNVDCKILKTSSDSTDVDKNKSFYHTFDVTAEQYKVTPTDINILTERLAFVRARRPGIMGRLIIPGSRRPVK